MTHDQYENIMLRLQLIEDRVCGLVEDLKPLIVAAVPDKRLPSGVRRGPEPEVVTYHRHTERVGCFAEQFQKLVAIPCFSKNKRGFPKEIVPEVPTVPNPNPKQFDMVPLCLLRNACCLRKAFKPVGGEASREDSFRRVLKALGDEGKFHLTTLGELGLRPGSTLEVVVTRAEAVAYGIVGPRQRRVDVEKGSGSPAPGGIVWRDSPPAPEPERTHPALRRTEAAPPARLPDAGDRLRWDDTLGDWVPLDGTAPAAEVPEEEPDEPETPRKRWWEREDMDLTRKSSTPAAPAPEETPAPETTTPVVSDIAKAWGGVPETDWDDDPDEHDDPYFEISPENVIGSEGITGNGKNN